VRRSDPALDDTTTEQRVPGFAGEAVMVKDKDAPADPVRD
jgi:hypothetical protein